MQKIGNISSQGILCLCWGHFLICKAAVHSLLTLPLTEAFSSALLMGWGLILSLLPLHFLFEDPRSPFLTATFRTMAFPLPGLNVQYVTFSSGTSVGSQACKSLHFLRAWGCPIYLCQPSSWEGLLFSQWGLRDCSQGKQCHVIESQDHLKIYLMSDLQIAKNLSSCYFCTLFWCVKQAQSIFQGKCGKLHYCSWDHLEI